MGFNEQKTIKEKKSRKIKSEEKLRFKNTPHLLFYKGLVV